MSLKDIEAIEEEEAKMVRYCILSNFILNIASWLIYSSPPHTVNFCFNQHGSVFPLPWYNSFLYFLANFKGNREFLYFLANFNGNRDFLYFLADPLMVMAKGRFSSMLSTFQASVIFLLQLYSFQSYIPEFLWIFLHSWYISKIILEIFQRYPIVITSACKQCCQLFSWF